MRTATEKYHAVLEGKLKEAEFVRQMRQSFPQFITQWNGYKDSVNILKQKGLIFEKVEVKKDINALADQFPLDAIERGIDIELDAAGIDSTGNVSKEDYMVAKRKVVSNLQKDANHYINLISGESAKVDKHDKYQEVKKNNHKDTFNDMKKADLKEGMYIDDEEWEKEMGRGPEAYIEIALNYLDGEEHSLSDEALEKLGRKIVDDVYQGDFNAAQARHGGTNVNETKPSSLREQTIDLIQLLKKERGADNEVIKDFIKTHFNDIRGASMEDILDEFDNFVSVNYEQPSDFMNELSVDRFGKKKPEGDAKFRAGHYGIGDALKAALSKDDKEKDVEEEKHPHQSDDKFLDDIEQQYIAHQKRLKNKEKDVEEAMDAATMDAVKNYKPGSLKDEPHSYQPGDMFTHDFDYEGMLKAGLKIRINTPVETMQAIYDSFEDVNYHRENAHLGEVIDAVKAGDKKGALDHLKMFRREIKNTLSDIFEGAFPVRERDENYVPKSASVVKEGRGDMEQIFSIIEDRASDSGFDVQDEAMEVMEAIGQEYEIDFEFGAGPSRMEEEKADKDYDGDGEVESKEDEYKGSKDKAIKKAMGKDKVVKESLKAIISKVLEEGVINEAATNELARIADDYAGFEGMKPAILTLQNIVSDIEAYYDKTREKIQKVYDTLGEIRNEEGLKVGGFLAPAIESAFMKDLRPVVKQGFTKGLDQPKVRVISQADIDAHNSGERPLGEAEPAKETVFTPNI